jgi:uncharacterized membrane protein YgcG
MASATLDDRRRALRDFAARQDQASAGGRFWRRAIAGVLILLAIAFLVLWLFGFFTTPPAVVELKKAVDGQVAEYAKAARGEVPFESVAGFGAIADKMREMPREYRAQIGQQMARLGQARERAEMASYFRLAPAERQAELDRRIKADEQRRQQWQAERQKRDAARAAAGQQAAANGSGRPAGSGGTGGGGPGGGGPGGGPAGGGGGPGGPGGPQGGGPPGGSRRTSTEEARNDRSKQRIDRSSPEERAQRTEYRRAIETRRSQLGLPVDGGRRG